MMEVDDNWLLLWEAIFFLFLVVMTIWRRKLSSNDGYRAEETSTLSLPPFIVNSLMKATNGKKNDCINVTDNNSLKKPSRLDRLPSDVLLHLINFLPRVDVGHLATVNKNLCRDTLSDTIWRQVWMQRYRQLWEDRRIVEIRRLRGVEWDPTDRIVLFQPKHGWLYFYLEFEFSWLDWLLAGCNTEDCCLIGLQGAILDVTEFLPRHPGSGESLTEAAGGDATDVFSDIGHSSFATGIADMLVVFHQSKSNRFVLQQRPSKPDSPSVFEVQMKRDRFFAERLLQHHGSIAMTRPPEAHEDLFICDDNSEGSEKTNNPLRNSSPSNSIVPTTTNLLTNQINALMNNHLATMAAALPSLHHFDALQRSFRSMAEGGVDTVGNMLCHAGLSTSTSSSSSLLSASRIASQWAARRLGSPRQFRVMVPLFHGGDRRHVCSEGCQHPGRLRMAFDPYERRWWGWWTCCGVGEMTVDMQALALQQKNSNNAIDKNSNKSQSV